MLDGLLGRGFVSKCKSLIKPTKTRLEALRKRAEAKQRFLKEDLAKLLANGLDINAYGRTEEFLAGLCMLSHYDFIEYTCDFILKNLSIMQKQRECPENCREAVGSLMFAAARFSDLPELRDLRDAFQERYGNSIEHFVNQKFVDKLASRPPTLEKKLQLLRDIALEFSIKWDSHGFEKRMGTPSALVQDQNKKNGPPKVPSDISKYSNGNGSESKSDKRDVISNARSHSVADGKTIRNSKEGNVSTREDTDIKLVKRQEYNGNSYRPQLITGEKVEDNEISHRGTREHYVEKYRLDQKEDITPKVGSGSSSRGKISLMPDGRMNTVTKEGQSCSRLPSSIDGRSDSSMGNEQNSQHHFVTSTKKVREVEKYRSGSSSDGKYAASIYTMQNGRMATIAKEEEQNTLFHGKSEVSVNLSELLSGVDGRSDLSASNEHESRLNIAMSKRKVGEEEADRFKSYHNTPRPPPYVKLKDNAIPAPYVKPKVSHGETVISLLDKGNALANLPMNQKDRHHEEGFGPTPTRVNGHRHVEEPTYQNDIPLPKPRSTRRKQSKSSSTHYDDEKIEDNGIVKKSSSSRRKEHSRKGLQLLFDDEHHQKDEEERMMDKLLLHYSKKPSDFDVGKLRKKSHAHASNHKDSSGTKLRHASRRDGPDVSPEMAPPPTRSVSLPHEQTAPSEPTKVYARANSFQPDNMARHVHPKLPDYDDLAAQFAAMRGR
ncbi:uncharacterized protein LOC108200014 [Daucus carota subsp. sativus]|uniref:uncharacterized protein LOC108200014 n=1 Tax=Daucus carota subsp. sativus TaxID=79200 RepID=UPI0007EF4650|nr:PREDICTED: uncharacterized protein LOC108200014 [Daucus carota subsp. sativus]XP_017223558.1 PREDICTED: uncharacterized protein LOC108200014 [Daucus carota subsp. sativus]